MRRVLRLPMTPKLGLDVLVAQEPHLGRQVPAVRAEQPPVQGDGRQQGQRRPQARVGRARRRGLGEESARGSHFFLVFSSLSFLLLLLLYVLSRLLTLSPVAMMGERKKASPICFFLYRNRNDSG